MKKQIGFVLLALALATQLTQAAGSQEEARFSSEQWLALVDSGKYAESWAEASSLFQSRIGKQKWVGIVKSVREPLGPLSSNRSLMSATLTKSLPGLPEGSYALLQFRSAFKNKAEAVETVTLTLEHSKWKVAGYFIR